MRPRSVASALGALSLTLTLGVVTPPPAAAIAPTSDPPNIVFILTDDQTLDALPQGLPFLNGRPGGHWIEFPNTFANTPLCCPARASILTGQYSHHTGVRSNQDGPKFDASSTIATWLDGAGYRTGFIGKYLNHYPFGLGPFVPPGWDDWFALTGPEAYYDYTLNDNGTLVSYGHATTDYSTDVFAARARSFITSSTEPFYLEVAPVAPHDPTIPAARYATTPMTVTRPPNFNEADVSDKPAFVQARPLSNASGMSQWDAGRVRAYRTLRAVDDLVRGVYETLEATGELDDTVIAFATDNGMMIGEHRLTGKACAYEECVRTPLMIRYPWGPGRVEPRLASNVDFASTFAELAGIVPPLPQDGRSLVPLLEDDPDVEWRDAVLLEVFTGGTSPPFYAVRTDAWKYVELGTGERELYDIVNDPYELENRAGQAPYADVQAQLATKLAQLKSAPAHPVIPTLAIDDTQAVESDQLVSVPVTLALATTSTVTVAYRTDDGSAVAPEDHLDTSGTLTFQPGERTKFADVSLVDDAVAEPDEDFTVTLSQPVNASIDRAVGTVTIVDDDLTPGVSIGDATVVEGDSGTTFASLPVTLSTPVASDVVVSYATVDGTAHADEDYVDDPGTVVIAPGEVTVTVPIAVTGDTIGEPDENFSVVIDTSQAIVVDGTGTVTITSDDPIASLTIGDVTVVEGTGGTTSASFTITSSQPSDDPITATFETRDGTAVVGDDYTSTSGSLVLQPGDVVTHVGVPVIGDGLFEGSESFRLELTGASVPIGDAVGIGTILDDESVPSIVLADQSLTEGNAGTKPFTVAITLSGPSALPVQVSYTTVNDTARAGTDYQSTSGVFTFAPGQTTGVITITVFGDTTFEQSERFFVDLSAPSGAVIGDARAIVTIRNDDAKG